MASIIRNSSGIYCDGFKCPTNTAKLTVSKKTWADLSKIDYVRECIDADGNVLVKYEITFDNPNPGSVVDSYIESDNFSNVAIGKSRINLVKGNDSYDEKEARKHAKEARKQVLRSMKRQQEYCEQWTKDFKENLQKQLSQH